MPLGILSLLGGGLLFLKTRQTVSHATDGPENVAGWQLQP